MEFLRSEDFNEKSLIDIGGGAGQFAKFLKDSIPELDITILDPSDNQLKNVNDDRLKLISGNLPNNLPKNQKYNYIHLKFVLHHLIGKTIKISTINVKKSLVSLRKCLKNDGLLIIQEIFHESYILPSLFRSMIFYLLKLQNAFKIKIPTEHFLLDLQACFYPRIELKNILKQCGFEIIKVQENFWPYEVLRKLILIKKWGEVLIVAKKKN